MDFQTGPTEYLGTVGIPPFKLFAGKFFRIFCTYLLYRHNLSINNTSSLYSPNLSHLFPFSHVYDLLFSGYAAMYRKSNFCIHFAHENAKIC